jgi:hypothetical protein
MKQKVDCKILSLLERLDNNANIGLFMKSVEFSEADLRDAQSLLTQGCVKEVQYSGSTYQVRVADPLTGNDLWCFLQLDDEGLISDCFCSCDSEESTCAHLAASWLKIYDKHLHPLHVRFSRSLWNQICRIYLAKFGDQTSVLQHPSENQYECHSSSGKRIFSLKLKTAAAAAHFKTLIEMRVRETEETSLKFSNLSHEEIALWKEGRPSFELRYELSFWSDLAKWMMELQEKGSPYQIIFSYSQSGFPNGIEISFFELELRCYISEANLPLVIPSLATVHSPLAVHAFDEEAIDYISYDKQKASFQVHRSEGRQISPTESNREKLQGAIPIEDWLYIKGDGFYASGQNFLLSHDTIPKESVSEVLNEHGALIERYLTGAKIYREPIKASYVLKFDSKGDLHIICYIKEPGDLQQQGSTLFKNWVYLNEEGFFAVEGILFDEIETLIPLNKLSDFVSSHRVWLNSIEGFHTHLASVEAHLSYTLDQNHLLKFHSFTDITDSLPFSKDLGDWVYVENEGFYAKKHGRLGLAVQPGVEVKAEEIPLFIHLHQDELEHIQGFFSSHSPVRKVGVTIKLTASDTICVTPFYHLQPGYEMKNLLFFDDVVYVKDEGFHRLPHENRLPKRFRQPTVVSKDQMAFFLSHELDSLLPFAVEVGACLRRPADLELELIDLKREGERGLSAHLSYHSLWGQVSVSDILQAMQKGTRFYFSKAGLMDLEEPQFHWLRPMRMLGIDASSHVTLSTMEMLKLQAEQDIIPCFPHEEAGVRSQELWKSICNFQAPSPPNLEYLKSDLRPYQVVGVDWLWFLYNHGLAGLLCDDMGLGKTHQTMALIAAVSAHSPKPQRGLFLVVCPTSVIYHWEDKLAQFLPHLRVYTFYGASRTLDKISENVDIILTSYGVLRLENEALSKVPFEVAIFDEAQIAKNHLSITHKALLNLKVKMRLGLTGTPIENKLRELSQQAYPPLCPSPEKSRRA